MIPNSLKKLEAVAKGVTYQVVPGDKTYADAQREEEERRRRAQQAAQAQAAQRQAAQSRQPQVKVAPPVQSQPISIAQPHSNQSL